MHFAAKNLLYQIHQSLDTQFVTVAAFKRYAHSPETRTFNSYMRRAQMTDISQAWSKGFKTFFASYLRKRPSYTLFRYISHHRRKQNPILQNFNSIKRSIFEKLQNLRQTYPAPSGRNFVVDDSQPSPMGWAKLQRPFRPLTPNAGRVYPRLDPGPAIMNTVDPNERAEGAMYLSPGQRPGNQDIPNINDRPEGAAYSASQAPRSGVTPGSDPGSRALLTGCRIKSGMTIPKALPLPRASTAKRGGGLNYLFPLCVISGLKKRKTNPI